MLLKSDQIYSETLDYVTPTVLVGWITNQPSLKPSTVSVTELYIVNCMLVKLFLFKTYK